MIFGSLNHLYLSHYSVVYAQYGAIIQPVSKIWATSLGALKDYKQWK